MSTWDHHKKRLLSVQDSHLIPLCSLITDIRIFILSKPYRVDHVFVCTRQNTHDDVIVEYETITCDGGTCIIYSIQFVMADMYFKLFHMFQLSYALLPHTEFEIDLFILGYTHWIPRFLN